MAETIKATNILVEEHKKQRNCCEEYSYIEHEGSRKLRLPEIVDIFLTNF